MQGSFTWNYTSFSLKFMQEIDNGQIEKEKNMWIDQELKPTGSSYLRYDTQKSQDVIELNKEVRG